MFNKNNSVSKVTVYTLVTVTTFILLLFGIVDYHYTYQHLQQDSWVEIKNESTLIAGGIAFFLEQNDINGMTVYLQEAFETDSSLQEISIYSAQESVPTLFFDRTYLLSASYSPDDHQGKIISVTSDIILHGKALGSITVKAAGKLHSGALRIFFIERVTLALVLDLALVMIFWIIFRSKIMKPIEAIQEFARATNETGPDSSICKGKLPYEFEGLQTAIEEMTRRLRSRYNEMMLSRTALAKAEKKYRNVFENVTDGIFKSWLDGTLITVNPAMARYWGYDSPEEFLRAIPNAQKVYVNLKDRELFLEKLSEKGIVTNYPLQLRYENGEVGWFKLNSRIIRQKDEPPYILALIENINERVLTEQALRESEAKYRALVETANDSIFINPVNNEELPGNFLEVNESACKLLHYTAEELTQMSPMELDAPDSGISIPNIIAELHEKGATLFETAHLTKEGRSIPVEVSSRLITLNGRQHIVSVARDITERKRAEEELRKSEAELRQRLDFMLSSDSTVGVEELGQVLNTSLIESLIDAFVKLTDAPIGIYDTKGRELVAAGWQEICTKFHRVNPETLKNCIESNTVLIQEVRQGEYFEYKCKNNMWDIVTPLYIEDKHVANIFTGQFFFEGEEVSRDIFRAQAERYHFDQETYLSALDDVPRFSREKVDHIMKFMTKLANVISSLGFGNLKLSKALFDQKQVEQALRESEAKYRALVETANDAIFIHGLTDDGLPENFLEVNESACKQLHYTADEFARMSPMDLDDPRFREQIPEAGIRLHEKGFAIFETAHLTKEGKSIPVEVSAKLVALNGHKHVVSIARDITERKRAEEELRKSEAELRQRLDFMLSSDSNIGVEELGQVLNTSVIQSLINAFVKLTDAPIGIFDTKGRNLVASGWQEICTDFHRVNPDTLQNCIESDTVLAQSAQLGGNCAYKCKNNLWDVVTPLYIENKHIGNIFTGQFFYDDEDVPVEYFRKQAERHGFNEEAYMAALKKVPRFSREKIQCIMEFLGELANVISSLGFGNLKLSKALFDQKQVEKALRESEGRYRMLFENLPLGAAVIDRDMRIQSLNNKMRGWNPEVDYSRKPQCFRTFFQPPRESHCSNCPVDATLKDGQVHDSVITVHRQSGEYYARLMACPIFNEQGDVVAAIELAEDITEIRRAEAALRENEKMTAVGRLARGIGHDFNNLFGSIANLAQLAGGEIPDENEISHDLEVIFESAEIGKRLVEQLLTFCRAGRDERIYFSPAEAVKNVLKLLQRSIPKEIKLHVVTDDQGETILADLSQFQQIIFNLCSNAVDAMHGDSGELSVTLSIESISSDSALNSTLAQGKYALLEVCDTGPGIDEDKMESIFDPFFTTKPQGSGTGLGLSVVHGVVTKHHGAVFADNFPGRGAKFKVYLPVQKANTRR